MDPPPVLVAAGAAPPPCPPGWAAAPLGALLADLPPRAPAWLALVHARLLALAGGLVVAAPPPGAPADPTAAPLLARLERAGAFPVAPAALAADPPGVLARLWPLLAAVRGAGALGSPRPALVLVGERAPRGQLPFYSRSGVWLLAALRALGHDELTLLLANALAPNAHGDPVRRVDALAALAAALAPVAPAWVALGEEAALTLRRAEVPHFAVPHPQWHGRFRRAEGVEGYARRLREAGVPTGPWRGALAPEGEPLPVVVSAERPELPPALTLGPHLVRPGERGRSNNTTTPLAADRRAAARKAFVTGRGPAGEEVRTLADAAAAAGVQPAHVRAVASREDWAAEREEHLRKVHERAKEGAVEQEARVVAQARRISGAVLLHGLGAYAKRLEGGEEEPDPRELEALGRLHLALAGHGDPTGDAAADRVRALSPLDQARELVTTLRAQFGDGVVERLGLADLAPRKDAPRKDAPS